jgi:hypothetical protein
MELTDAQIKKLERIRSIHYQVIEKAMSDQLSNNYIPEKTSNSISFVDKKGKDIKTSLTNETALLLEQKVTIYKEMESKVQEIGESPNSSFDDYILEGWRGKIEVPKKYCSAQLYKENNEAKEIMYEYNNSARRYIEVCVELKKIQTIINNIDENKTYKLTIDIASKLGF